MGKIHFSTLWFGTWNTQDYGFTNDTLLDMFYFLGEQPYAIDWKLTTYTWYHFQFSYRRLNPTFNRVEIPPFPGLEFVIFSPASLE
jgi:hypothetical protein